MKRQSFRGRRSSAAPRFQPSPEPVLAPVPDQGAETTPAAESAAPLPEKSRGRRASTARVEHPWVTAYLAPYAGRTTENYLYALARWSARCEAAGIRIEDATRQDIESWRAEMTEAGCGPRTIRSILTPVRGLYRYAIEEGYLDRDPSALVRLPRTPRTSARSWLHPDDLLQLLDYASAHADPATSAMLHLHGLCGTRPGETRRIDVRDIAGYGSRTALALRHRKEGASDRITVSPRVAGELARAIADRRTGPLLLNAAGDRIDKSQARERVQKIVRASGVPHVTPYGLRTGFIIIALSAGVPEREVMHYVGHTTSSQTAYYDRLRTTIDSAASSTVADHIAAGTSRYDQTARPTPG